MIFSIVICVISSLCYCFNSAKIKKARDEDISALEILSFYRYLILPFLGIAWISHFVDPAILLSSTYFITIIGWLVLCCTHNYLEIILYKHFPLSIYELLSFIFISIGIVLVDIYQFGYEVNSLIFIGLPLVILGLYVIHKNHPATKTIAKDYKKYWLFYILLIALRSLIVIFSISLSKTATLMQPNIVFHSFFVNALFFTTFYFTAILCIKKSQDLDRCLNKKDKFLINIFMALACMTETIALKIAPLMVINLINSIIPIIFYAILEHKNVTKITLILPYIAAMAGMAIIIVSYL